MREGTRIYSEKHDQEYIKKKNQRLILETIRKLRPISRSELAKRTRMSATSVGRIVGNLIAAGWVKETDRFSAGVGRKATMLDVEAQSLLSVGAAVDRNTVQVGFIDLDGHVVAERKESIDRPNPQPEQVAGLIADMVLQLAKERGTPLAPFLGVGIGLPGIINTSEGAAVFSAQLGWKNERFAAMVEAKLGLPVVLDNDLKVKALGESGDGALSDQGTTVLLSIGSGVGSALVVEGRIYRGATNIAGEIGHTTIHPNGRLCECGKRGCLQTYITDLALLQEASLIRPVSSVRELFERMRAGEGWAADIIDRACTYAAVAVSSVVCAYNPDVIVLTGDFIDTNPEAFELVLAKQKDFIREPFAGTFELQRSRLGNKAIMI